jgi:hypothetical protein
VTGRGVWLKWSIESSRAGGKRSGKPCLISTHSREIFSHRRLNDQDGKSDFSCPWENGSNISSRRKHRDIDVLS